MDMRLIMIIITFYTLTCNGQTQTKEQMLDLIEQTDSQIHHDTLKVNYMFIDKTFLIKEKEKIYQISFYKNGHIKEKSEIEIILSTDSVYYSGLEIGVCDELEISKKNEFIKNGISYHYDEIGTVIEECIFQKGVKVKNLRKKH